MSKWRPWALGAASRRRNPAVGNGERPILPRAVLYFVLMSAAFAATYALAVAVDAPARSWEAAILLVGVLALASWRLASLTVERMAMRQKAELHAKVFDWTTEGVIITDATGAILDANQGFARNIGYLRHELVGRNPRMFKSGRQDDAFYRAMWGKLARTGVWEGELYNRRKDGRDVCEWVRISAVRDARGKPSNYIAVYSDISARKAFEERLQSAVQTAQAANRAKNDVLATVSHELRTPLNAIIGFSEVMEDNVFGPLGHAKYQEYAADIHESGEHLLALIDDVLDISAIERGEIRLASEAFSIAALAAAAIRQATPSAERAGVALASFVKPGLPALRGDERRVRQILLNLLTNAVKFTPEGGSIEVRGALNAVGGIEVSVRDDGIGMDAAEIEIALQKYGQVDQSLRRKQQGMGLGLPLARTLAELHGGDLAIVSEKGRGTTVTVTFPPERTCDGPAGAAPA